METKVKMFLYQQIYQLTRHVNLALIAHVTYHTSGFLTSQKQLPPLVNHRLTYDSHFSFNLLLG